VRGNRGDDATEETQCADRRRRAMRVMVVGVGRVGSKVLLQLRKNPDLEVVTVDARERPLAVERGIIDDVDSKEPITPMNLNYLVQRMRPDIVLLTRGAEDLQIGDAPGMDMLASSLRDELMAVGSVPIIDVARD
jgi:hypothetical protein